MENLVNGLEIKVKQFAAPLVRHILRINTFVLSIKVIGQHLLRRAQFFDRTKEACPLFESCHSIQHFFYFIIHHAFF